ncbi:hypothetical protein BDN67DRAFT_983565 [Paxillus ammoniavirescens]|nr:hypothetical protein BDN67DRAFT_983565 [Paxillus ammoniavirescens]
MYLVDSAGEPKSKRRSRFELEDPEELVEGSMPPKMRCLDDWKGASVSSVGGIAEVLGKLIQEIEEMKTMLCMHTLMGTARGMSIDAGHAATMILGKLRVNSPQKTCRYLPGMTLPQYNIQGWSIGGDIRDSGHKLAERQRKILRHGMQGTKVGNGILRKMKGSFVFDLLNQTLFLKQPLDEVLLPHQCIKPQLAPTMWMVLW